MPSAAYELIEFAYAFLDYLRLRRAVRRFHPDCLYERYNLFSPAGVWIKRRYGLPLLLEVNAPLLDERSKYNGLSLRRLARWTERLAWRGADFVLPVTKVLAERIRKERVPESKIVVVPNGVEWARFEHLPPREEANRLLGLPSRLVLGFTEFVRDWHGLDRAINFVASHRQNHEPCQLLIVGDGPARPSLEKQARDRGVEDLVTVTGIVTRKRLPLYLAAFDIALQPAVVDYASPLKLFEYMAAGCTIVAPATANIVEVLTDGDNAALFVPENLQSFAQAVESFCNDAELRNRLGRRARETLLERGFLWKNNAAKVIGLFARLPGRATAASTAEPVPVASAAKQGFRNRFSAGSR